MVNRTQSPVCSAPLLSTRITTSTLLLHRARLHASSGTRSDHRRRKHVLRCKLSPEEVDAKTPADAANLALDALVSFALVSPLVATFWRGGWVLVDEALDSAFGANEDAAGVASIAAGTVLLAALLSLRLPQPAGATLTTTESIRERLFSYGLALAGILTWHGVWELWEYRTEEWSPLLSGAVCHFSGLAGLLALRSLRSTLAPPACVALDDDAAYGSIVPTMRVAMLARGIRRLWD